LTTLFEEFCWLLESDYIAAGSCNVTEEQRSLLRERLPLARIKERCGCGQSDCRTYEFFTTPGVTSANSRTVRFFARGEALLHTDEHSNILGVERLDDLSTDTRYIYSLQPDGTCVCVEIPGTDVEK
jgi:hypothetical protein